MSPRIESTTEPDIGSEVSIVPDVSILGVLSHLNYEPWYALAEYVDNAIQSANRKYTWLLQNEPNYQLNVDISYDDRDGGHIAIVDNAGGIARREFARAFKAAEVPPDRSGLSEFGMGMKSASIWFAKNWRVVTTSIGDPNVYTIDFDMTRVLQGKLEHLDVRTHKSPAKDHFTRIELWNLNQRLRGRTLGKTRDHLREIYRAFLRDRSLNLTVAGQQMEYAEPDILYAPDYRTASSEDSADGAREWRKNIDFYLDGRVHITGWAAIRSEGKTSANGLSLFRRRRVIVGTGDTPYRPSRIYGQGNSYRSQRLFGELDVDGLPVSHTKDGFQWQGLEEALHEELRAAFDAEPLPLLRQAEHYRARKASRAELKRIQQATTNTAQVAREEIPPALDQLADGSANESGEKPSSEPCQSSPDEITENFAFEHDGRDWSITIIAGYRPSESSWLIRSVNVESGTGNVTANLVINTGHPFLRQFALGSADGVEAVFRLAVALVVTESLQTSAGDGESASQFMRQVDSILSSALSKRSRRDL